MTEKYLDESVLKQLDVDKNILKNYTLSSSDTIDETELLNSVLEIGKVEELLSIALQIAIIGTGGKTYNTYRYNDENKSITDFFKKHGITYNNNWQEKLNTKTLSPRRLTRIFRKQIYDYLTLTDKASYLYVKYSTQKTEYKNLCFPGAEHMVKDKNAALFLLETYKRLDKRLVASGMNGTIQERIKRVFLARGVLEAPEMEFDV